VANTDFAQPFWFDGYYYVIGIRHVFDSGTFTQELHMVGQPVSDSLKALDTTNNQSPADTDTLIESCYDSVVPCGSSTTPVVQNPAVVPQPSVTNGTPDADGKPPTNTHDAASIINAAIAKGNPSDVKGWDQSPPSVKQAIIDASRTRNIDVVTLALIAACESRRYPKRHQYAGGFDPTSTSNSSSAAGLFQFIDDTWKQYANTLHPTRQVSKLNPHDNADAGAWLANASRQSGADTVGDIYLCHFLGPVALTAIKLDKRGRGSTALSEVYNQGISNPTRANKSYLASKAANPRIFTNYNSASALRAWANITLASYLKSGKLLVAGNTVAASNPSASVVDTAKDKLTNATTCPEDPAKVKAGNCNTVP
jgi:hypothetical protein